MGLELELEVEDEASIFSASAVRARLAVAGKPVTAFRETLGWGRGRLYSLFAEGTSAESLVKARSFLVDEVLREAWTKFLPGPVDGLALIAVGGYGRGELLPHSDIDLLLLHDAAAIEAHKSALEQFMAFLWDMGLEVGSSVRSVKDCAKLAAGDITIMTTLLESRPLMGDSALFQALQSALGPVWPVAAFYKAKLAEQKKRHAKYDDTGYKLEPNVKEGPGGLRDIHTVAWVAKRHFGAQTLHELKEKGFLTAVECSDLFAGQDFLWRVRFAIHMLTGRKEDRLLFDHQIKVAALFGYVDDDRNRAVEQFMQLYYRTIKSLSCLNDLLLQLFDEAIVHGPTAFLGGKPKPLNARFELVGGYIQARSPDVFRRNPYALLEIFLLQQQHPKIEGIRAETLRLIRRDRRLVDEGLRGDVRARALFLEMFREGRGLTRSLRRMNRYGVLGRYLPAFGQVIGHMQYDLFHTLTVDEHSLYVVRNLRRFAEKEFREELPFASTIMPGIEKKELLYLAGLFHDIAKGRGGDHSEIGADDAQKFCLEHGLSHDDAELVAWLVRNHLLMSLTAQKQDVSDPEVVNAFAQKVVDRKRLDYIFLLTCADIRATNPALWNSWRESLLTQLYRSAARALERGPLRLDEAVQEQKAMALPLLKKVKVDAAQAEGLWRRFETDYFLRHSPAELAWHWPAIHAASDASLPLILVQPVSDRGTTVFIYMRDRDHLFGLTCGVLAQLGLNILDARLNTTADGYTLDSFMVMEGDGSPIVQDHRRAEIRDALRKVLADPDTSVVDVTRRTPARLKHFTTPTTIFFSQDVARHRTLMELVTADRPGLLSLIGRVFHRRGILLDAAKINTVGERAEDVFFITGKDHRPIVAHEALEELREVLTRTLHRGEFVAEDFKLTAVA